MNPAFNRSKTRYLVLKTIVDHEHDHPMAISMDEIAAKLDLSGRPAVHYHIQPLIDEGFIKKGRTAHRYIRSTERGRKLVEIIEEEHAKDQS